VVRLAAHLGEAALTAPANDHQSARFALAPPRHFLLPAVLLLIAEEPSHGYQLVKALSGLHFGPVDRPAVYRVLAQLEADGLVEAWSDAPVAGSMRRVYGLTDVGGRVLRAWMGIIKQERDALDGVLRRYTATGTVDALLAEAESGLVAVGGTGWSPVAVTTELDHRPRKVRRPVPTYHPAGTAPPPGAPVEGRRRYGLVPDRSVVLVEARSTVGPISFGALGLTGVVEVDVANGRIVPDSQPTALVEVPISSLRSGNRLYDAELLRRIDAARYPVVTLDLHQGAALGVGDRYRLEGSATVHGVTRAVTGTVEVHLRADGRVDVSGEQVFDIRDFGIESPTVLMLRIYPDVTVRLHVEAVDDAEEVAP
jgi:DNA-binding PadR family transcriptional regulator/polyisoprenoid-binding protein YceI